MSSPAKYFVSEIYPQARFQAGVLREDIEISLKEEGYSEITLQSRRGNLFERISSYLTTRRIARALPARSIVFFHFPLRARQHRFFFKLLKTRGIETLAYVHDLEGLRDQDNSILTVELSQLNKFDRIIAQNERMRDFIIERTGHHSIGILEMYDYLHTTSPTLSRSLSNDVAFAGNLAKASFTEKLATIPGIRFFIYGEPGGNEGSGIVIYKGKVDPRELPGKMEGSFGLVWDGSSLETGEGAGAYLRYNTSHKLALYIMAGLPIIIWKEDAMADWVFRQGIGALIERISDIPKRIESITLDQYESYRNNMVPIRLKMSKGEFLKKTLREIERKVFSP